MKKCPEICTVQDFVDLCDKSGAKIKPTIIQYHDFYEFENDHRNKKSKNVALPHLDSMRKGYSFCAAQEYSQTRRFVSCS